MLRSLFLTACACMLAAASASASAQDPLGTIEGAVTDTSAAAVPAAHVTARNLATGLTRDVVARSDGFYRVTALPVGTYLLIVEATRFARVEQQPIPVT